MWPDPAIQFKSQFTDADKRKFAYELLRNPNKPWEAAVAVFGDSHLKRGLTLWAATCWPTDETVVAELRRLNENSKELDKILPTKAEIVLTLWEISKDTKIDTKNRLAAIDQASDLLGYKPKAGTNVNVTTNLVNKVMAVKDHGTDDEWEKAVAEQQKKLVHLND